MTDPRTTRDALLDAAYDAVVAGHWESTRMLDVARTAGVSRQTLYNEFGSKDSLAEALAMREAQTFIDGVQDVLDNAHPRRPVDAVEAATVWTLRTAADNPLLKATLTNDAGGLLPFLTTRAEPLLTAARDSMSTYLAGHWPDLPRADLDLAVTALTRLTVSYLVLPGDGPDASAETIAASLAHLLDRLLTKG